MKKNKLLYAIMCIIGLITPINQNPLFAQSVACADTVTVFPWENNSSAGYSCWLNLDTAAAWDSYPYVSVVDNNPYNDTVWHLQVKKLRGDTAYVPHIIATPALQLPIDTGVQLHWKISRIHSATENHYQVLISTTARDDISAYDTIYSENLTIYNWQDRICDLSNYAGQVVYIAFCHSGNSSTVSCGIELKDVAVYRDEMPFLTLSYPFETFRVGDTVGYTATLTQGDTVGLTYTWHSAMLNLTQTFPIEPGSNVSNWNVVYSTPCTDTITVTAANMYGSVSRKTISVVVACDTITGFPWVEEFVGQRGPFFACWQSGGWTHPDIYEHYGYRDEDGRYLSNNSLIKSGSNGQTVVTPPISLTDSNSRDMALWLCFKGNIIVTASYSGDSSLSLFTDTIYSFLGERNTWRTRTMNLSPFFGQTIHIAIKNIQSAALQMVAVDYDTLPSIGIRGQEKAITDSTISFTALWRHGDTSSLHYEWHSKMVEAGLAVLDSSETAADSLMGTTGRITYLAGGTDTVMVVAVNSYGRDTAQTTIQVVDCTPVTELPWTETFSEVTPVSTIACWYLPEGSNWNTGVPVVEQDFSRAVFSDATSDSIESWLVSRAIVLPSVLEDSVRLYWDVSKSSDSFQQNYSVLVCPDSDYANLAAYTPVYWDTMPIVVNDYYFWDRYSNRYTDLTSWAGQTIRVAFCNRTVSYSSSLSRLFIDNVSVRYNELPRVELDVPSQVYSHLPLTYSAEYQEGSHNGLNLSWHSTLLDTTINGTLQINITYETAGTDTITLVATNVYGSDTATKLVTVNDCGIDSLPWTQSFLNMSGTTYNGSGKKLSACWITHWEGGNANYGPHILASAKYPFSWVANSHLFLMAGGGSEDYDTVAIVESPWLEMPLTNVWFTIWRYAGVSANSSLSVGFMQDTEFVSISLLPNTSTGAMYDTVFLGTLPSNVHRIALQWKCTDSIWCSTIIGGISVYGGDTLPEVLLSPPSHIYVGDTTTYYARLINGQPDSLFYSWHSTLLGIDTIMPVVGGVGTWKVTYLNEGIDTIRVIAINNYGSDTTELVVNVTYNPLPWVEINGPTTTFAGDNYNYTAIYNGNPYTAIYTWHSSMVDAGDAIMSPLGNSINIIYTASGNDTLTVMVTDSIQQGTISDTYYVTIADCSISTFPYNESFENYIPSCWLRRCGNTDTLMHSWFTETSNSAHSGIRNLMSQNLTGIDSADWLLMPVIDIPDSANLALYFWVNFVGDTSIVPKPSGLAVLASTTGRMSDADFTDTLFFESNIISSPNNNYSAYYVSRTVPLSDYAGQRVYLAFVHDNPCTTILLDDISIDVCNKPVARLTGPSSIRSCDSAIFNAELFSGDTNGITYTWHSNKVEAGLASAFVIDNRMIIDYFDGGNDVVTVIVTNAYGSDTVQRSCTIIDCEPPDTIWRTVTIACANWEGQVFGSGSYPDSSLVTIEVVPIPPIVAGIHVEFDHWNDGDTNNPRQVFVVSDTTFTAYFRIEEDSVGINEVVDAVFDVYPNPSSSTVTIEVDWPTVVSFVDINGRVRKKCEIREGKTTINVSSLPSGIYLLHISNGKAKRILIVE